MLFIDGWIEHNQFLDDRDFLGTWTQVMIGFDVEVDFGRTIDTYVGDLDLRGVKRAVDFFRVGRILLAFQTLDRSETGFFNKNTRTWELLPASYRRAISEGITIARKQAPPNLLRLPIQAPELAP